MTSPQTFRTALRRPCASIIACTSVLFLPSLLPGAAAHAATSRPAKAPAAASKTLAAGALWIVDRPTHLTHLTIAQGARVEADKGQALTLLVDGVERDLTPGSYSGNIALVPTQQTPVRYTFIGTDLVHPFRQALFIGSDGIVAGKSVLAAAGDYRAAGQTISGVKITALGANFNGIHVTGGDHTIRDATIDLTGLGANDFAGFGAGVLAVGQGTRLVIDGARIRTHGVTRTTVVADKGAHLVVRNSTLSVRDGVLPPDYVENVSPGHMLTVPWMLGLHGNVRAAQLLGDNTQATYINSDLSAENWGVLSNDIGGKARLTTINSHITITGQSGYGAYSLGGATTLILGSDFHVRDFGLIVDGGECSVLFASSASDRIAQLNADLDLRLTPAELAALPRQATTITSDRFGVMMHATTAQSGAPTKLRITDDTVFNTGKATFLLKGVAARIEVDGAKGAQLRSRDGVLLQMIDSDDPGAVMEGGLLLSKGVYHEPAAAPAPIPGFDTSAIHNTDVQADFANITLKGDFYNAYRDGAGTAKMEMGPQINMVGAKAIGRNVVLSFRQSRITGVITSAAAHHAKPAIGPADYRLLGEVSNRPEAAVNNGVIVSLAHSTWVVTGVSYLSRLTLDEGASIAAPDGSRLTMSVDGKPTPIAPGTFTGRIVLMPGKD